MTGGARHRRQRVAGPRGERGAVLVELSFVALLLFTIAAGAFDYGQAWRSGLAVNEASRTAARVGSAMGDNQEADFNALSGAKAALARSGKLDDVTRVVVYRSTSDDGEVPASCKTGASSACTVIEGDAFRSNWEAGSVEDATTASGCLEVAASKAWCPTSRVNLQLSAEYFGVWIRTHHDFEFPLLGDGVDVERSTVMRLEPPGD